MKTMLELNKETFEERRNIHGFLNWLNSNDMGIARCLEGHFDRLTYISENHDRLIDRYLNIDSEQLEKERRELLESIQK